MGSTDNKCIASGNGLARNRWQAITWTNDDRVKWCIYVLPGFVYSIKIVNSKWLGAVRQQAITWANVDRDACPDMTSLGHNESNTADGLLLNRHLGICKHCDDKYMVPV